MDAEDSGDVTGTVGSALLIAALAGILLVTLSWFWLGRRRHGGPAY